MICSVCHKLPAVIAMTLTSGESYGVCAGCSVFHKIVVPDDMEIAEPYTEIGAILDELENYCPDRATQIAKIRQVIEQLGAVADNEAKDRRPRT